MNVFRRPALTNLKSAAGKTLESKKLLDPIGRRILEALRRDARSTFAELGREVGLSAPAVIERVRRLEEAGVIRGYHADVRWPDESRAVLAFVRMKVARERYARLIALTERLEEVLECHHVSGEDSFVLKVAVPAVERLEELISRLGAYGPTTTAVILSSPVSRNDAGG